MRKWKCVPMIILCCLLLTACAGRGTAEAEPDAAALRSPYHDMNSCTMTAAVSCSQEEQLWEAVLQCNYIPGGESTVEVLEPENIAGIQAVLTGSELKLVYQDLCLNAGTVSTQEVSPMACLPRLMSALRDGWLLEENRESWNEIPCLRLTVDQSGIQAGKLVSTIWLRLDDGTPLRGEISVEGETILTADFSSFNFA